MEVVRTVLCRSSVWGDGIVGLRGIEGFYVTDGDGEIFLMLVVGYRDEISFWYEVVGSCGSWNVVRAMWRDQGELGDSK